MSTMVSFVLSFFPRDVLDEILNLIESVSEDFPSYSLVTFLHVHHADKLNICSHELQSHGHDLKINISFLRNGSFFYYYF